MRRARPTPGRASSFQGDETAIILSNSAASVPYFYFFHRRPGTSYPRTAVTHSERILILDFGSQYTQLIARKVRECGVYAEIHPFNIPIEKIRGMEPVGIILSGGPSSVYAEGAP